MTDRQRSPVVRLEPLPASGPLAPPVTAPRLLEAPVVAHAALGPEYRLLTLGASDITTAAVPGQFLMLTVARPGEPAPVLPRPMAIYGRDRAAGTVDVAYRIVGEGTRRLAEWGRGETMVTVGPLGRGFVVPPGTRRILLLGRGIGTCSLTMLAAEAAAAGVLVTAVASARRPDVLIGPASYAAAGVEEVIAVLDTDGSSDTTLLSRRLAANGADEVEAIYVCGSARLLSLATELAARSEATVQVSLEAHMACGLGFCHGCASGRPGLPVETPLVCTDGPVFRYVSDGGPAA